MSTRLRVPERDDLFGHWYLLATAHGFLNARPRLDTVELIARPGRGESVHFHAEFTVPRRRYRFETDTMPPEADGRFDWIGVRGLSVFTKAWTMATTDDASVLTAYHHGSLIIQQGWAVFARAEVPDADARATVAARYAQLGMSPRTRDELTFRPRPRGMHETGASQFRDWALSTTRPARFQILASLPR